MVVGGVVCFLIVVSTPGQDLFRSFNNWIFFAGVNHEFTWTITGEPFAHCIAPGKFLSIKVQFTWIMSFLGDTMKFNWSGTFHNVQSVDKDGYDNCSGFSNTQGVQSPYIFNGTTAGTYYFVCGVRIFWNSKKMMNLLIIGWNSLLIWATESNHNS